MVSKKRKILEQAVALMGAKELAACLHVSEDVLGEWVAGPSCIPDARLVGLAGVLADYAAALKKS